MSISVPFIKKNQVESMALELLDKYSAWKKLPLSLPINVDDIIEGFFKLRLEFCDLKQYLNIPDVLGATWFDEKVVRIDSSLEENEARMAFTMAHEVGHWFMHRPYYEMNLMTVPMFGFGDVPPSAAIVCRTASKKEPAEWQADQFAATLLAPPKMLRNAVKGLVGGEQIAINKLESFTGGVAKNPALREAAKWVIEAGFTNVSVEAMCYRLIDLNLVVDTQPSQSALF